LNDIFGMWWRRAALCLYGIGIIRTREGRASYHPWDRSSAPTPRGIENLKELLADLD
jgi:hypothetical protein